MNLDDVKSDIENARWFSALGSFVASEGYLAVLDLHAWDSAIFDPAFDKAQAKIAMEMDWLPSSNAAEDPVHGSDLTSYLQNTGVDYKPATIDVYKTALRSLRTINGMRICCGPNDFTQAAHGAALFCARMAAMEVMSDRAGFWCSLLKIYREGNWPCGVLPDKTVVVY